jgi:hypothetical protein
MPAGKLENGWVEASLTNAAIDFQVTAFTEPNINGGDAPDTTTNSNGRARSKGAREHIDIEDFTLSCAFLQAEYDAMIATLVNSEDILTVTDRQGSTEVYNVRIASYTAGEKTEDGFPTADVAFTVLTGADGNTLPTITPAV